MKPTDYLVFIVFIGLIVGVVSLSIGDFNTMNVGNDINLTGLNETYDKVQEINEDVNESVQSFQRLADDDASWFSKISSGIVAIPKVVIALPLLIIKSGVLLSTMISESLTGVVPPFVIFGILSLILIMILRRFMEFFQRART